MKRSVTGWVVVSLLLLGSATCLVAQRSDVDRFLQGVSSRPVGGEVEQDQSARLSEALSVASPAEAEGALPVVLQYARSGSQARSREYATMFLLAIGRRPDGAELLFSRSAEISSLLVDANPAIQHAAIAVIDYVMRKPGNMESYAPAMLAAMQEPQTPQEVCVNIIGLLLSLRRDDPAALKSVLDFLHRDDLTAETRTELVHELPGIVSLPEQVSRYLVSRLDDPDPHVRAMVLVSYADSITASRALAEEQKHPDPRFGPGEAAGMAAAAIEDSKTAFHILARDRVERMAHDPNEDPRIRALAKDAIAGKYPLTPNYDLLPYQSPNP
jgi:hypothetical protein